MADKLTLPNIASETKRSLKIALPLIASEIIFGLSGFFATILIADLGKESLAAHAITWSIYFSIMLFSVGIVCSVSILVSQSFGAKDHDAIGICLKQGLILAVISSPLVMLVLWLCPIILVWTNQDPVVIELAKPALHSLIWTILPLNIMIVMHHFLMGINKAYIVTIMSIVSVPVEIFFFYAFLFGKFGLPALGLSGIGYGLTASYYLITTPFLLYVFIAKQFKKYSISNHGWSINFKIIFELISMGLPLGMMFSLESGLFAVIAIMMGKLGTNVLAAYQISYQYLMIALVILFALIQAITVVVGIEVGRNNRASLRLSTAISIVLGIAIMAFFSFVYIGFPEIAIGLDIDTKASHTQELVAEASRFLTAVGILILVDCIRLISTGALRGLKDTKIPLLISVIGFWCIAFPTAYVLAFHFGLGGMGIWYGIITGLSFSATILSFRFNHISKYIDLKAMVTKAGR
jgi:MATE family multidrug resistance protein